jgi:hypothetical protein
MYRCTVHATSLRKLSTLILASLQVKHTAQCTECYAMTYITAVLDVIHKQKVMCAINNCSAHLASQHKVLMVVIEVI